MKVGISLDMLTKEGRFDARRLRRTMALGDLAEPLRFDSPARWSTIHHAGLEEMSRGVMEFCSGRH